MGRTINPREVLSLADSIFHFNYPGGCHMHSKHLETEVFLFYGYKQNKES